MDNLECFRAERVWEKLLDDEGNINESMDVGNELVIFFLTRDTVWN